MDKFIADPHLSHNNIINFERTQFNTIEEHDTFIKNLIKSNVKPDDTLYVLGDIGECSDTNIQFWKSLPCRTILIRGNHDQQKNKLIEAFDAVSDVPIFHQKRVLLSHEPLPVTHETLNLHGHLHGAKLSLDNHINLSIHVAGYKLFTEKDINKWLINRPKISQNFLFEWYAPHYVFNTPHSDIFYYPNGSMNLTLSRLNQLKKGKMRGLLDKTIKKFVKEYPEYNNNKNTPLIIDFILEIYPNNANFTPKDVKEFIAKRQNVETLAPEE